MANPKTIEALKKAVGKKLVKFDFSDENTCIVLFFEEELDPMSIFSSKKIVIEYGIEILEKVINRKVTNVDYSDNGTCVVLLFEDIPILINIFSTGEIVVEYGC
jgi:hypothetical protein